jgi:phasin family protein
MFTTNEQFSKISLGGVETVLRFAQISLDSAEKLVKFNLEVSKQSLEDNIKVAKELADAKDPQEAVARINKLATESVEHAVSNSRNVYEIVTRAQGELAKLAEENMGTLNKSFITAIEDIAKNAPAGSEVTVNAVKTSVAAAAAAINSFAKAAQQVNEFAETSVKAASSATADAVKGTTKRTSGSNSAS